MRSQPQFPHVFLVRQYHVFLLVYNRRLSLSHYPFFECGLTIGFYEYSFILSQLFTNQTPCVVRPSILLISLPDPQHYLSEDYITVQESRGARTLQVLKLRQDKPIKAQNNGLVFCRGKLFITESNQ